MLTLPWNEESTFPLVHLPDADANESLKRRYLEVCFHHKGANELPQMFM